MTTAALVPRSSRIGALGVLLVFVAVLIATRSPTLGDTGSYANDITPFLGAWPVGRENPLWEFGHLFWRPLGWAGTMLAAPALRVLTDWTPFMQAAFVLIAISTLSAMVTVVLWYKLILDVTQAPKLAFFVTLGFSFAHGFLLYAHAGCSYIPGLACLTAAIYALRKGGSAAGGAWFGLAVALWFPFILAGAALLLLSASGARWEASVAEARRVASWRQAGLFLVSGGVCVGAAYGLGAAARQVSSPAEAQKWFVESQHGWQQSIRAARLVTGLPRSFIFLGRDGVLYRRFLFKDPYAPVSILDMAGASLWKIGVFGLFVAALLYELFRKPTWGTVLVVAAGVPVLIFAVFLFEPGSPERYLPAMPFVLLAAAWALREIGTARRLSQLAIAGFLAAVVLVNGYSFARPRVSGEDQTTFARVASFRPQLPPHSIVLIATNQDLLNEVISRSVFSSLNRPSPMPFSDILPLASEDMPKWRERVSGLAARAWAEGGEVWVSKRMWSAKPLPEWYWVEGEDARVSWADLAPFFSRLRVDADRGGPDGFRRIVNDDTNLAYLKNAGVSATDQ